jgi:hypothetical protein
MLKKVATSSNRGSKPGERRGGRHKGVPNKATIEIRELARKYGPDALKELSRLSTHAESEQARVSAIKEILDRAYGKSPQPLDGDGEGGPITLEVAWLSEPSE